MHTIFRMFYGAPTGDMNNILLNGVTTRNGLEKVIREYITNKYDKSPKIDVPKIDDIIIEHLPKEEVYPYRVSYLSKGDPEPHLVGSITDPFYDEKNDITSSFPSLDQFYQRIALKQYKEAFTETLAGSLLFSAMKHNRGNNQGDTVVSVFTHLDNNDVWELYRVLRECPKLMRRCD